VGRAGTLADGCCDALVGTFNDVSGSECPRMGCAEGAIDHDPTMEAEIQLAAHEVDALLSSELEDDATDVEPPMLARAELRHLDPSEIIRPNERIEPPPGQFGNATFRPDA